MDNKTFIRCSYCNIKGHGIAECRFRQKEEYNKAGAGTIWCRYCKCAGHTIDACKKRMYKEQVGGDKFLGNRGASGYTPNLRKCYKCGKLTDHIAKYCNENF